MKVRQAIPTSVRDRVLLTGRCTYCGATDDLVIDHVHPWSRGGTDAEHNLTPACERCNNEKGDATITEWRDWRLRAGLTWPVTWPPDERWTPKVVMRLVLGLVADRGPISPIAVVDQLPGHKPEIVRRAIQELLVLGLMQEEARGRARVLAAPWLDVPAPGLQVTDINAWKEANL